MFEKKIFTLFIGRETIEPGLVTLRATPVFTPTEAFAYAEATLPDVLSRIRTLSAGRSIRVVLSEALVYVVGLTLPSDAPLSREWVRARAEETVPEDLRATVWDFQKLQYAARRDPGRETRVHVAVLERVFCERFCGAFRASGLPVESAVPESVILAESAAAYDGVSLVVARGRTGVTLVAAEAGFVIATQVKREPLTAAEIAFFLEFVGKRQGKTVRRIIFSHCETAERQAWDGLAEPGRELLEAEYNPLIGVALRPVGRGNDEAVLDIEAFRSGEKRSWWRR